MTGRGKEKMEQGVNAYSRMQHVTVWAVIKSQKKLLKITQGSK